MYRKKFLFLVHIPVWIVAFVVAYFFGTEKFPGSTNIDYLFGTLTYLGWFLGSFYVFYAFLIPKYLEKGKVKVFGIYAILFVLVIIPVLMFSIGQLTGIAADELSEMFTIHGLLVYLVYTAGGLFCSILGSLYRFSIDWFHNLHLVKDLENIKLQTELVALKSRLNPHFLFNTLNNIDTLIQENQEKASVAIAKLSDLLRYVVYETVDEKTSIQKELDTVRKYIDLERLRISNPDLVTFNNSITKDFLIPPMIFMPFIENAFKHSNLNQPNQRISIFFSEKNDELFFQCLNTIAVQRVDSKEKGVGLELVRKRLDLTFPGNYSLKIEQQNNEYVVLLKINFA